MDRRQAEVLRRVIDADRVDLHTGMPGRVRSFSVERQTAEIELGLRHVIPSGDEDEADATEAYPILPEVPVLFPSGGGFRISWPLAEGDDVWIMFAEADLSRWRETGEISDPGVSTRHGLSGAVAYPGIHHRGNPNGNATSDTLRIEKDGGPVFEITPSEVRAGGTDALALDGALASHLDAIAQGLDALMAALSGGTPTPQPNYGMTARNVLKISNPIATTTTKGA